MAQAVVLWQGLALTATNLLVPPPIPSALNVNEWWTVYSHQLYQLFTHPPLSPSPGFLLCQICLHASKLASTSDHLSVAVIFSPARL